MHKPKYNNIEELPSQSPIYLPGQGGVPVHSGTNRQCKWSIHSTGAQGLKAAQLSRRSETFTDANRVCVWVCVITVCVGVCGDAYVCVLGYDIKTWVSSRAADYCRLSRETANSWVPAEHTDTEA